jgi:hypothetical protein
VAFVLLEFNTFVLEAFKVVTLKFVTLTLFRVRLSSVVVDITPLIVLVMRDPALVRVLLLIMVVLDMEPPIFEVIVLVAEMRVLLAFKLVTVKLVTVVVANVLVPITLNVPVAVILLPVAFPKRKLVIDPVIALRRVEKNEVEVAAVRVVVARADVPLTANVPLDTNDEVAVIDPPVKVLRVALMALIRFEKNEVVVALVIVAFVPKIPAEVRAVAEALESAVCPDTVSAVAEALVVFNCEIVVVASVEEPDTARVPVAVILLPVAFPKRKLVIDPVIALRRVEKNEVEVAAVRVVVESVDVPVTVTSLAVKVFVEFRFPTVKVVPVELVKISFVIVALVAVRLVKKAVTEFSKLAKKLVEVAEVVVELEALKLVVRIFAALVVPVNVRLFREEMVVVAITPFTLLVKIFVFVSNEFVLLVIILLVAVDPPRFEVSMFPVAVREFEVFRFVIFKFDIVVVARVEVPLTLNVSVLVVLALILSVKMSPKYPVKAFRELEKKKDVVALLIIAFSKIVFVAFRFVMFPFTASMVPVA